MGIRTATAADLPAIHRLVGQLAEYEKELEAFTADLAEYERDFAAGWFEGVVAEDEQAQIVGMAVYYETYSTWKGRMLYLEDFVVSQSARRSGLGQMLFDRVLDIAREKQCKLLKWQVLDWNEPALNFYRKNGAIIEEGWWNGKIFV